MDTLVELRKKYFLTQAQIAEFLGVKRSKYSMLELEKRNKDSILLNGLNELIRFYHLAETAPNDSLTQSTGKVLNDLLVAELIKMLLDIEDQIKFEEGQLAQLEEMHNQCLVAYLALQMMEIENKDKAILNEEQAEWLLIQLRLARKRLREYSAFKIYAKRIQIVGLNTQLDQLKSYLKK